MRASPPAASRSNMAASRCGSRAPKCARSCSILRREALRRRGRQARRRRRRHHRARRPQSHLRRACRATPICIARSTANVKPKPPAAHKIVGKSIARFDIPGKVTGGVAYVQDLRLPGMLHGRVVRPPSYGAKLAAIDEADDQGDAGRLRRRARRQLPRRHRRARGASHQGKRRAWRKAPPGRPARRCPTRPTSTIMLLSLPDDPHVISDKQAPLPDGRQGHRGDLSQALHGPRLRSVRPARSPNSRTAR